MNEKTALLRHTLATLAYRGGKALGGAPAEFADFRLGSPPRTPGEILAHVGDLLDWSLSMAEGSERWHNAPPLPWEQGAARFFAALEAFDRRLASAPPACSEERLFQGPIADALTHVGQIAMLRRLAGCPMHGENYFQAEIVAGRVGVDQAKPVAEF